MQQLTALKSQRVGAFFLYGLGKFVGYWLWCIVGLGVFWKGPSVFWPSLAYGSLRFGMGVLIGAWLILSWAASIQDLGFTKLMTYALVYPPVRILEWGFIALLLNRRYGRLAPRRAAFWVVGGIVLSCLLDIPMLQGEVMPKGRIFC